MKRFTVCLVTTLLLFSFIPAQAKAVANSETKAATDMDESAYAAVLLSRLDAIREMDKTALTPPQKKELRQEVRTIKGQLKETGGGVYLSVGAIILLAILLVLLL